MIVGCEFARRVEIIEPDADHVNISICPGVSITTYPFFFDIISITWSNFVVNKFSAVRMPPFGYC
jgi:hypothetical protein